MSNAASLRLERLKFTIMDEWVKRALKEVPAAGQQKDLALRNSLPDYLNQLVDALSTTIDRTHARIQADKVESTRIGKKHGQDRARSSNYSIDQLILEYHILRQVICDVMEREAPLAAAEREVIVASVEQAVNDAATEYSGVLKDIQEQFTRSLAHDFRSPLQTAKLNLQLILRKPDDTEMIINRASRAIMGLERLDRMIMDLLDASRMKEGSHLTLELHPNTDLNWIVKEVASDLNVSYENRIVINSKGPCIGTWNESALRRVVENLVNNAIKYGTKNGAVTIGLGQTQDEATLSVHNEGKPIPHDELDLLFEQFRRLKGTHEKTGWGLGLTVVKGVAEALGGRVEVVSEEGQGTTFFVKIPIRPKGA